MLSQRGKINVWCLEEDNADALLQLTGPALTRIAANGTDRLTNKALLDLNILSQIMKKRRMTLMNCGLDYGYCCCLVLASE